MLTDNAPTIAEDETLADEEVRPAISFLNRVGDCTLVWDESNREKVLELIRKKMKEGYSFFILKPRKLAFLGSKKVKATKPEHLEGATGIVLKDAQVNVMLADLTDAVLNDALQAGTVELAKDEKPGRRAATLASGRRAATAEEVITAQTIAIRPVVGG